MKNMIGKMAIAGGMLGLVAACQPTPAAEAISANDDLDAVEFSRLDADNSGTIDAMEAMRTQEAADRGGASVPDAQVVDVQDDG